LYYKSKYNQMQACTKRILQVLHILSWIFFIGVCIIWGAILISFFVSLFVNPAGAKNLHNGLNLSGLMEYGTGYYAGMVILIVLIWWLKAFMLYWLIKIFRKVNHVNPFTKEVATLIQNISLTTLAISLFMLTANVYSNWLSKKGVVLNNLHEYIEGGAGFLFMAGIIYFIAQVFKRGVEIQSENDLTV
jgi:Protein of unknown function (DUF2975)